MTAVPSFEFTIAEVSEWLNSNGFEAFSENFHDEGVDGESLACLTERALESLVDKVGPQMKLLSVIKMMEKQPDGERGSNSSLLMPLSSSQTTLGLEDSPRCSSPLSTASSERTSPSRRSWVTPFTLPEQFPPIIQGELMKNANLPKKIRIKFIQIIYDRICLFTISPTPDQR